MVSKNTKIILLSGNIVLKMVADFKQWMKKKIADKKIVLYLQH
jgi:translation initiation factor IF-2